MLCLFALFVSIGPEKPRFKPKNQKSLVRALFDGFHLRRNRLSASMTKMLIFVKIRDVINPESFAEFFQEKGFFQSYLTF